MAVYTFGSYILNNFSAGFGSVNLSGVTDPNSLAQIINALQGQQFEYGQRGANFNY